MSDHSTGRSDIVDIAGEIRAQTECAIQFYDGTVTVWLPRSQVEIGDDGTIAIMVGAAMRERQGFVCRLDGRGTHHDGRT